MRSVAVAVTARASYSRIKTALEAIRDHPDLELHLIVGGSALLHDYGNTVEQIASDGLQIAARVYMVLEGENPTAMAKTAGLGMLELSSVLNDLRPDVVVTVADRYETIATALAASYMNIPVAHVQGGEVTGSIDEKVRHAVTKLSDLHLVSTEGARDRVIRMGESLETVHVTGCPSIDLAARVLERPELDFDPLERYGGVGAALDISDGYVIVLQHPVTTEYGEARSQIEETLDAVIRLGLPTMWFWPNVDAGSDGTSEGIRAARETRRPEMRNIHFFTGMGPVDFLKLAVNSRCIVGNSSVAIRECSYLGVPAVNIGTRQRGRERGANVVDVEHDRTAIAQAIESQAKVGRYPSDGLYGDGKAGERVAHHLASEELTIEKRIAY